MPVLPHVRVEYLPKNIRPTLQPMKHGVIACIGKCYKQKLKEHAVDLIDSSHSDSIPNVDMYLAAMWVYEIWDRLENEVI